MRPVFKTITHLESALPYILPLTPETLVIFDMDLTLTMPPLAALAYLKMPTYRAKLQELLAPLSHIQQSAILKLGLQVSAHQLVEQETPIFIKDIQGQGIKTMVLTAILTGQINHEAPIELQRYDKLRDLGIVIENAWDQAAITFPLTSGAIAPAAVYYKGILCASGEPGTNMKGPALASFLKHVSFFPTKVIMIDDKKQHLDDVYQSLATLLPIIEFIGLEYIGIQQHLSNQLTNEVFEAYWQNLAQTVAS
jgi:hypothetical protein